MKTITKLWIGIVVLVIISPLGLILPERFKAGPAWGEWDIGKVSALWNAPMPDYAFKGCEEKGLPQISFAYIISGIIGVAAVFVAAYIIARLLIKKNER